MRQRVILDTGPSVALLNARDDYHSWAKVEFAKIKPPLLSCESVISEVCFLLRSVSNGPETAFNLLSQGVIGTSFRLSEESESIKKLLIRYAFVPISLADACLVRMTEQFGQTVVLTLDRDFLIYRKHGRQVVPVIMP